MEKSEEKFNISYCVSDWLRSDKKRLGRHFRVDDKNYVRCACSSGWWLDLSDGRVLCSSYCPPHPADPEFFDKLAEWLVAMHRKYAELKDFPLG